MTKKRKLHDFKGTIKHFFLGKVNSKGEHYQQPFYYLEIEQESLFNSKTKAIVYAFPNLVTKDLWNVLEQESYLNKKYLFWCEKRVRGWRLIKWEEIS